MKGFVDEPVDNRCVRCLPQGHSDMIYNRPEVLRRCMERVGVGSFYENGDMGFGEHRGEVFLTMKQPLKTAFQGTQLGARCVDAASARKFEKTDANRRKLLCC